MIITDEKKIKTKCTACGACISTCPKKALYLEQDQDGFYYPKLNDRDCVSCGKCVAICPIFKEKEKEKTTPQSVYAGYSTSETRRRNASSGGIFPELAEYFIAHNGAVFGVAFDENSQEAIYNCSDTIPVDKLYGSKYVESKDEGTIPKVKEMLDKGRIVLYCGTPCKIDGLLSSVGQNYDNLYTVDFMCHGKPSAGFLYDVIKDEEKRADDICTRVTFREKLNGWRKQTTAFYFSNNDVKEYESSKYFYYYYFLHNYTIRKSCVACTYYKSHMADITLSDYWQVPKVKDDDKGISLIQINTEKGKKLIDQIYGQLSIQQVANLPNVDMYAHTPRKGYKMRKRDAFYRTYKQKGLNYFRNEGYERIKRKDKRKQECVSKLVSIIKLVKR